MFFGNIKWTALAPKIRWFAHQWVGRNDRFGVIGYQGRVADCVDAKHQQSGLASALKSIGIELLIYATESSVFWVSFRYVTAYGSYVPYTAR